MHFFIKNYGTRIDEVEELLTGNRIWKYVTFWAFPHHCFGLLQRAHFHTNGGLFPNTERIRADFTISCAHFHPQAAAGRYRRGLG